jgi:6-phosphogluconolactonase/glucosamine-6-phosphate isomerase/deaminase
MEIIRTDTPKEEAGKALSEKLHAFQNTPVLLLVSGGSSFSILEYCAVEFLNEKVTLGVLDERYSHDPSSNNYLQLTKTSFFEKAVQKGVQIINSSIGENEPLAAVTKRIDQSIKNWVTSHSGGKIIVTMGIGEDGHVAGIMPSISGVDFSSDTLIVGYSFPKEINQYNERITVTYTFLKDYVTDAIVYAVGASKQKILEEFLLETSILDKVPALILKEMSSVKIFTDK